MKIYNNVNLMNINKINIDKIKPNQNGEKQDDKALKEATDKFEAIFIKQFLDLTLKPETGTMPKGIGSDIHTSMYTRAVSEKLSGVFGISEMLFNHLKNR